MKTKPVEHNEYFKTKKNADCFPTISPTNTNTGQLE